MDIRLDLLLLLRSRHTHKGTGCCRTAPSELGSSRETRAHISWGTGSAHPRKLLHTPSSSRGAPALQPFRAVPEAWAGQGLSWEHHETVGLALFSPASSSPQGRAETQLCSEHHPWPHNTATFVHRHRLLGGGRELAQTRGRDGSSPKQRASSSGKTLMSARGISQESLHLSSPPQTLSYRLKMPLSLLKGKDYSES